MKKTTNVASARGPQTRLGAQPWAWLCALLWLLVPAPRPAVAQPGPAAGGGRQAAGPAIFLRAVASRPTAYVGQALTVSYLLYYRVPVIDPDNEVALKFSNCYVEEYPRAPAARTETIGGQVYRVQVLRKYLVVPQLAGTLDIPVLAQRYRSNGPPAAEDFFGEQKIVSTIVRSARLRVPVRALPPPADSVPFCHAVGQLRFRATYTVARKTDNLLTVRLQLTGPASLQNLKLPLPQLPAGVDAFNVRNQEQHTLTAQGLLAKGTYTYEVVANYQGSYTLPGITLQYFDPDAGRYVAYAAPAYQWRVSAGLPRPPLAAAVPAAGPAALYTKPDLKESPTGRLFFGSRTYYGLLGLGLMVFLAGIGYTQQQRARAANPRHYRSRQAKNWALRALKKNEQAHAQDPDQFCKGLNDILVAYIGNKLGPTDKVFAAGCLPMLLQAYGVPAPLQARTLELLALLSRQRFSLGQPASVSFLSQEVGSIINQLDTFCRYA
ncbi:MAG: hypothetical protein ACRYFZ_07715 [Janthinobacterium lividum]